MSRRGSSSGEAQEQWEDVTGREGTVAVCEEVFSLPSRLLTHTEGTAIP